MSFRIIILITILPEKDMKLAADYLNTTFSHVYGVATYYSMFSVKPRGKYIIRVCNSPVCNMEGSDPVLDKLKEILGIEHWRNKQRYAYLHLN